jgi:hypothetical protein
MLTVLNMYKFLLNIFCPCHGLYIFSLIYIYKTLIYIKKNSSIEKNRNPHISPHEKCNNPRERAELLEDR